MTSPGLLAVVERSGLSEEFHDGAVAVVGPGGRLCAVAGDVDRPFYYRSASKPFSAQVCLEAGADLPPVQLALACASHSGDPVHVAVVGDVLAGAGLSAADLGCPPDRPRPPADRRLAASGDLEPAPLYHNCSGKHAGMLAACVAAGWDTATYLAADHPLQVRIGALVEELSGVKAGPPGVDGCGAPAWRVTAAGLARAFWALATDGRFARVRQAMAAYPRLVSGMGRNDAAIGSWLGAPAKGGAAGCLGVAVAGHGVAAKAWSGSPAVAGVGVGAALRHLGMAGALPADVTEAFEPSILGGGHPVGRIRAAVVLESL